MDRRSTSAADAPRAIAQRDVVDDATTLTLDELRDLFAERRAHRLRMLFLVGVGVLGPALVVIALMIVGGAPDGARWLASIATAASAVLGMSRYRRQMLVELGVSERAMRQIEAASRVVVHEVLHKKVKHDDVEVAIHAELQRRE